MTETDQNTCSVCSERFDAMPLERCAICHRHYCRDCAYRAPGGRRFCSEGCGRAYYFHGEDDDDDRTAYDE